MQDHTGPNGIEGDQTGPNRNKPDQMGPKGAIRDHKDP